LNYFIVCKSLTYAQRISRVLERAGIGSFIMRAPRIISSEGCRYCVKLSEKKLAKALQILKKEKIEVKQVYMQGQSGDYQEVPRDLS